MEECNPDASNIVADYGQLGRVVFLLREPRRRFLFDPLRVREVLGALFLLDLLLLHVLGLVHVQVVDDTLRLPLLLRLSAR